MVYVKMRKWRVTCAALESFPWQRYIQTEPPFTESYQSTVHLSAQLIDAHAPVEYPHRQSRCCAVEHRAGVQTNDDDGYDHQQMCKVKYIEMLSPYGRECGDKDSQHDQTGRKSSEDERCPPDTKRGRIARPDLVVQIRGVQYWEDQRRAGKVPGMIVGGYP